ncbi:MAG TPA: AroM family protein, partial [Dermatophilaceae bacterium]|nr:AroM family protein [Dermatophilaceae bacterium]
QVRVGMILPMAGQVDDARVKWRGLADPIFAFASPYSDDVEALVAAAYDLVDAGARALVLDCMGFSRRHREALRARGVEVPVLVANEVVGGVVRIAFS